ncbi:uncharacterized protein LOC143452211 [Clavelina lepadiformis]|uniref:uncharacterized protein LOC143452211 n=1 Tax=Clavelina lepadiformis TaxID=159417 RepID=UPI0040419252
MKIVIILCVVSFAIISDARWYRNEAEAVFDANEDRDVDEEISTLSLPSSVELDSEPTISCPDTESSFANLLCLFAELSRIQRETASAVRETQREDQLDNIVTAAEKLKNAANSAFVNTLVSAALSAVSGLGGIGAAAGVKSKIATSSFKADV